MYKKEVIVLLLSAVVFTSTACGKNDVTGYETSVANEAVQTEKERESDDKKEEVLGERELRREQQEQLFEEVFSTEETFDKAQVGDQDTLAGIIDKYDKVFSDSSVKAYFGYNVPAGWKRPDYYTWADPDGREEKRSVDHWINENNNEETIEINSFSSESFNSVGRIAYDSEGNEWEIQSDETEYINRYNDALHIFYETEEWTEPERANYPMSSFILYCTDRIPRGEIDTPYGRGILYSAVYEWIFYTEYDDEMHCYTMIDDSEHYWSAGEGMILEIDNYYIEIEYLLSDWEYFEEYPEDFINAEYTGRLNEIIPQMFETK